MTDREKAVVMAYTGVVMLKGDKLKVFYDYVSEIIGRPVYTHELPSLLDTIKEAAFPDFCMICKTESEPLERRIRELEKQLSDVSASPFDGGMSQKEYFHGETDCELRERWVLISENPMPSIVGGRRYRWKCTGCGAGIETKELRPPAEHRCYICGACMDWGVSDG